MYCTYKILSFFLNLQQKKSSHSTLFRSTLPSVRSENKHPFCRYTMLPAFKCGFWEGEKMGKSVNHTKKTYNWLNGEEKEEKRRRKKETSSQPICRGTFSLLLSRGGASILKKIPRDGSFFPLFHPHPPIMNVFRSQKKKNFEVETSLFLVIIWNLFCIFQFPLSFSPFPHDQEIPSKKKKYLPNPGRMGTSRVPDCDPAYVCVCDEHSPTFYLISREKNLAQNKKKSRQRGSWDFLNLDYQSNLPSLPPPPMS